MGNTIPSDDTVNSEPLEFHAVHADNIEMSSDHRKIHRVCGQRGLSFSNRPVRIGERIFLRINDLTTGRRSKGVVIRFGFTAVDPSSDSIQATSEMSISQHGYWVKPVSGFTMKRGGILFFCLNECGEVIYGRKETDIGLLFTGVRVNNPLWAVVDLSGTATAVEFVEVSLTTLKIETSNKTKTAVEKYKRQSRRTRSTEGQQSAETTADDTTTVSTDQTDSRSVQRNLSMPNGNLEALNLDVSAVDQLSTRVSSRRRRGSTPNLHQSSQQPSVPASETGETPVDSSHHSANNSIAGSHSTAPRHYPHHALSINESIGFHEMTGHNVIVSEDRKTATRRPGEFANAYVFTERPLKVDDELVIKIAGVTAYRGGMTVGLTTKDPATLRRSSLPNDPHKLLDRPEYWAIRRDVHTRPKVGNEICFRLKTDGELMYYRNGRECGALMFVDCSMPMWMFIDVYGITNKIECLGLIRHSSETVPQDVPVSSVPSVAPPPYTPLPDETTSLSRPPEHHPLTSNYSSPPPAYTPRATTDISSPPAPVDAYTPPIPSVAHTSIATSVHAYTPPVPTESHTSTATSDGYTTQASTESYTSRATPEVDESLSAGAAFLAAALQQVYVSSAGTMRGSGSNSPAISSGSSTTTSRSSTAIPRPGHSLPRPLIPLPSVTDDIVDLLDCSPTASTAAPPTTATVSSSSVTNKRESTSECAICLEKEPNSALYPCGHMCVCYECAISIQHHRSPLCPICRQPIVDVLRIYR